MGKLRLGFMLASAALILGLTEMTLKDLGAFDTSRAVATAVAIICLALALANTGLGWLALRERAAGLAGKKPGG